MASAGKKWLTGCAIGCVVLLGILGLFAAAGFMMVRNTFEGFQQAQESSDLLAETHGSIAMFTPPPPDNLPADRLQTFIKVRRNLEGPQRDLETAFQTFPDGLENRDENPLSTIFKVFRGIGDLVRPMGAYLEARNRLLLEADMGQGEYLFYYGLIYYAWLGHAPDDAPRLGQGEGDNDDVRIFAGRDAAFSPAQARLSYRFFTQAMMRNLEESLAGASDPVNINAAEELAAELGRFEQDPDHIAWSSPLPPAWLAALEPLQSDLEPTYSPTANIFEWPQREEEGRRGLGFTID